MTTTTVEASEETRTCSKCHGTKPVGEFSGSRTTCKACANAYRAAWRAANPDKVRAYAAKYRKEPERQRRNFFWKHNLTPERFEELFDAQGRVCAICGSDDPNGRGWHIDHDHTCCPGGAERRCGKCFRGILCHNCNVGLGHFGDDVERLLAAIRYLGVKVTT